MPALLDQRHLCGAEPHLTPQDAMQWSRAILAIREVPEHQAGSAEARVDNGRWIIDCDCDAGVACTPGFDEALCVQCGANHPVVWPKDAVLEEAISVLELRPEGKMANWDPREETVEDLKLENLEHAVPFVLPDGATVPDAVHPAIPLIQQMPSGMVLRSTDPSTGKHRYDVRRDR